MAAENGLLAGPAEQVQKGEQEAEKLAKDKFGGGDQGQDTQQQDDQQGQ